jgi:hypothetical protein
MSISSCAIRTSNLTITAASAEIRSAAGTRPKILEVSIIQSVGTAQSLGLGRPAAIGVTPGTTSAFQPDDPGDAASTVTMAASWATSPTAPVVYHRRWNSAATIGVGIVWTFPRGLVIPVSSSIVVFNITAAQASDLNVALDE